MTVEKKYLLIQDPYSSYAYDFLERIKRRRPDCIPIAFYTNARRRFFERNSLKIRTLFPDLIEYVVPDHKFLDFVEYVSKKYNIVGVLPWSEPVVDNAVVLLQELSIPWNIPDTIRLYRNKFEFKEFLYSRDPALLPSRSILVKTFDDFLVHKAKFSKPYVIKPTNGHGNKCIGFFSPESSDREIKNYFEESKHNPEFTVEEFLDGDEYAVNGQIDHLGNVHILSIFHYERVSVNGRQNVYAETWNVSASDPAFALIARYAEKVMKTTDLIRCPFHMEVIIDKTHGPCLIEVGCRAGGGLLMNATNYLHNHKVDAFDIAAHYYLSAEDYGPISTDWNFGEEHAFVDLDGISDESGHIFRMDGKSKVEALPEFVMWTREPQIGQELHCTTDLESAPWALHLSARKGKQQLREIAKDVRGLMRLNHPHSRMLKIGSYLRKVLFKVSEKAKWWGGSVDFLRKIHPNCRYKIFR